MSLKGKASKIIEMMEKGISVAMVRFVQLRAPNNQNTKVCCCCGRSAMVVALHLSNSIFNVIRRNLV